jgi:pentatricopeptide repeat protein
MGTLAVETIERQQWWSMVIAIFACAFLSYMVSTAYFKSVAAKWQYKGLVAYHRRDLVKAEKCFRTSLKVSPFPHDRDESFAFTEDWLGFLLNYRDKTDEAMKFYMDAVQIEKRIDSPYLARSMHGVGWVFENQGNYEQAERWETNALEIRQRVLGDHPDTAVSLNSLANLYVKERRFNEAESLYHQAMAMDSRALGPHNSLSPITLYNLAALKQSLGRLDDAQSLYEKALSEMQTNDSGKSAIAD